MCFLAWTLCYSVRVDMSVAIVAMVNTSELYQTKKYMIYSITKLCCLTWSQWRWELITNRNRVCGARRRVTWGTKDFVNNCQGIKIINIYSRLEKKDNNPSTHQLAGILWRRVLLGLSATRLHPWWVLLWVCLHPASWGHSSWKIWRKVGHWTWNLPLYCSRASITIWFSENKLTVKDVIS